jgi:hypothetical protein
MKLQNYPLPIPTDADRAFPTYDTDARLLEMAKELGFDNRSNPYYQLVSNIFFQGCGGFVPKKELWITDEYAARVFNYFDCLLRSWKPKHEHKTAVCAFLLSEIVEPEYIPNRKKEEQKQEQD